jgi:WD40 repeat protein
MALFSVQGFAQGDPDIIWKVDGHSNSVEAVAFSPDGQTMASGADYTDSQVKLWRTGNGELLHTLSGHATGVRSVDFSPDGQYLAAGYIVTGYPPGGEMKVWDLSTQTVRHTFGGCFAAFSPDGAFVASGGGGVNRYLQVHVISNGEKIAQFYNGSYITSVEYSPDGKYVATGGSDNTIKLWDIAQGKLARTLTGHTDDVQTIAFSPDGQVLASGAGGWDNPGESTIKLWRVSNGNLLDTFEGHGDWVQKVAFSPDGKILISSGRDGTYPSVNSRIKLWRIPDGQLLEYYDELAFDLAFSPDGRQFSYGQGNGSVVVAQNPVDAFETHLFYTNNAVPGSAVDIKLIGPNGASPVGLWAGSGVLDPPLPSMWGDWYLEFPLLGPVLLPPIPAGGVQVFSVHIPTSPSGPYDLPLQALIGDELTNLCILGVK